MSLLKLAVEKLPPSQRSSLQKKKNPPQNTDSLTQRPLAKSTRDRVVEATDGVEQPLLVGVVTEVDGGVGVATRRDRHGRHDAHPEDVPADVQRPADGVHQVQHPSEADVPLTAV